MIFSGTSLHKTLFLEVYMRGAIKRSWTAAVLIGSLAATTLAVEAGRTAADILKSLDAVKMPTVDRTKVSDPGYVAEYRKAMLEAGLKRDELIHELYKADPDNTKLPSLMSERWMRMMPFGPEASKRANDIKEVLDHTKNPKLKVEALHAGALGGIYKARETGAPDLTLLDEFIKVAPKDERGPRLLYTATFLTKDEKAKEGIEDRILKQFPDSSIASSVQGTRRKKNAVGKPFELEFTDAINGSTVSIKNLKGKVVVLDFWATWCGPCVAEMPQMKGLYAKFHKQGVEFIGVSLDRSKEEGGLDSLKKFVKDKEITWPQYYQGNFWDSEFSRSWGINSIPAMFVVDQDGKLVDVEARGKLEQIIPALLEKRGGTAPGQAGGE